MLDMPLHRTRQGRAFEISRNRRDAVRATRVIDGADHLLDDWPLVQLCTNVMSGRPNDFHASLECLTIRTCSLEAREQTMVDVDHSPTEAIHERRRQDLHIASQYYQVDVKL